MEELWYGAFHFEQNSLNLALTKSVPLSDTISSGNPRVQKIVHKL